MMEGDGGIQIVSDPNIFEVNVGAATESLNIDLTRSQILMQTIVMVGDEGSQIMSDPKCYWSGNGIPKHRLDEKQHFTKPDQSSGADYEDVQCNVFI